ncbi:MAG: sigma-54 dependent transcriptional regulator [Pseudomonadota bacterium]|nr:sigma-54 dependent transcriptional regulator [Pseudomonadota bacterium]
MATSQQSRILLVEDSRSLARAYEHYLRDEPVDVTIAETGGAALTELANTRYAAVLLDLRLPDMDGMDILKRLKEQEAPPPVIVITAHGSINLAVEAMRLGAFDFLVKPFNAERLVFTLRNATERQRLALQAETIEVDETQTVFCSFIGNSPPMRMVYKTLQMAAPSKATVFVVGESGTGKELAAGAVHQLSPRVSGPLVAINCAAIPKGLIESEIFGHVRGAFTGAVQDREGAASRAHGGTLFLDEICEMDLDLQSKLLRFVQTGSFERVGDNKTRHVDVRFVCATNQDPAEAVREGRFREDLFYRLHVIPVSLPPLRERGQDILLIAETFLRSFAKEERKGFRRISPAATEVMLRYRWPGNVRELQNVIRSITVLYDGAEVTMDMLPPALLRATQAVAETVVEAVEAAVPAAGVSGWRVESDIRPLADLEREAVERAIELCDGNIARAATLLGVSPSTIYRKKQVWDAAG